MLKTTLPWLKCAAQKKCSGELMLMEGEGDPEVVYGTLECKTCKSQFPILAGVAIVVEDVASYLYYHVKGISKFVPDQKIPKAYRDDFLQAKSDIEEELTEEDLESDRVNALYLMNHYLSVKDAKEMFWLPETEKGSPHIEKLIESYWDQGPLSVVAGWIQQSNLKVVELGCGVGGLFAKVADQAETFFGIDGSFQSILLARHFNLGTPYSGDLRIPSDLYHGAVSKKVSFAGAKPTLSGQVDFIVGEMDRLPIRPGFWDVCVSMNVIDMLEDPRQLPEAQAFLLKPGGLAIQSDPYIWHAKIAKRMRNQLPKTVTDSARAVEYIYEKAGFKIQEVVDHVPWIFFKHLRQIELYSVHAFSARKK